MRSTRILTGSAAIELASGRTTSAVALAREIRERVLARIPVAELDPMRHKMTCSRGLDRDRERRLSGVATELDIAIKRTLSSYCARTGAALNDPRVARSNCPIRYHGAGLRNVWCAA